jgi:hypothetical protein
MFLSIALAFLTLTLLKATSQLLWEMSQDLTICVPTPQEEEDQCLFFLLSWTLIT